MNPAIWKLIRDYMNVSLGKKYDPLREDPVMQEWDDYVQQTSAKDVEGMEAAMQEGVPSDLEDSILSDLVALDQRELILDSVGIYEKNDPVYVKIESERTKLIKQLEEEKKDKKPTKKLVRRKKGGGRSFGGGGALPPDLTGSGKTLPRGLVRRDKKKY